ncbi:transposable element Tcb2 transposase [Trichonephila clavipes]|nr:transposable element Tcb2 transposase [Trichonephila clavipes]
MDQSVISRLWQMFQRREGVTRQPVSGRPRVTTPRQGRYLVISAQRQRSSTARALGSVSPDFIFMDDNAQCHRAVLIDDFLETENIQRMSWPASSPDLNTIDHFVINLLTADKRLYDSLSNTTVFHVGVQQPATVGNAVKGFKKCGIETQTLLVISEHDFAASKATDHGVVGDEIENTSANPQTLVVGNQHINPPEEPEHMANAVITVL